MVKIRRGTKTAIARELGISPAALAKQARRGCPVDNADAARRWRAEHLHPGRVKPDPGPSPSTLAERATELAGLAQAALDAHQFELLADRLRAALAAVPESHRPHVVMTFGVWNALIGPHALSVLDEAPKADRGAMSDDDALFVGAVCYSLACGELVAR